MQLEMDRTISRILQQIQLQIPILDESMCIIKAGLSSLRYVREEYKDKVPDVSDFHRNIGTSCNSKFNLPKFKDLCLKSKKELLKDV